MGNSSGWGFKRVLMLMVMADPEVKRLLVVLYAVGSRSLSNCKNNTRE